MRRSPSWKERDFKIISIKFAIYQRTQISIIILAFAIINFFHFFFWIPLWNQSLIVIKRCRAGNSNSRWICSIFARCERERLPATNSFRLFSASLSLFAQFTRTITTLSMNLIMIYFLIIIIRDCDSQLRIVNFAACDCKFNHLVSPSSRRFANQQHPIRTSRDVRDNTGRALLIVALL